MGGGKPKEKGDGGTYGGTGKQGPPGAGSVNHIGGDKDKTRIGLLTTVGREVVFEVDSGSPVNAIPKSQVHLFDLRRDSGVVDPQLRAANNKPMSWLYGGYTEVFVGTTKRTLEMHVFGELSVPLLNLNKEKTNGEFKWQHLNGKERLRIWGVDFYCRDCVWRPILIDSRCIAALVREDQMGADETERRDSDLNGHPSLNHLGLRRLADEMGRSNNWGEWSTTSDFYYGELVHQWNLGIQPEEVSEGDPDDTLNHLEAEEEDDPPETEALPSMETPITEIEFDDLDDSQVWRILDIDDQDFGAAGGRLAKCVRHLHKVTQSGILATKWRDTDYAFPVPVPEGTRIVTKRRPLSHKKREALREFVVDGLRSGVIEKVDQKELGTRRDVCVLNMTFPPKKDGRLRPCLDPRPVNELVALDPTVIPGIETVLMSLDSKCKYWIVLDIKWGFWHVSVRPEDRWRLLFYGPEHDLYRFVTMPFGLKNAPAHFRKFMEMLFRKLPETIQAKLRLYVDDILIMARSYEELADVLEVITALFEEHHVCTNVAKIQVGTEVRLLGMMLDGEGLHVDPRRFQDLRKLDVPSCVKDLRHIIGVLNFMGTCLPDLALKVRWLADKCKKGVTWEWNHEDTTRLGSLLGELEDSLVVRAIPDYSKPFVLRTDASVTEVLVGICSRKRGTILNG